MAKGFIDNIEDLTLQNTNFRRVLYTGKHSQLVVMNLKPLEEIGMETHPDNDQFLRIEKGKGKVVIDGIENNFSDGFAIIIPAGSAHNVINTSDSEEVKLYTLYSPPHHKDKTIHETKEMAMSSDEEYDDIPTEG